MMTNVNKYFDEIVKIIWYEVGEAEDAIGLFTRLNIGKIPLTNAEPDTVRDISVLIW